MSQTTEDPPLSNAPLPPEPLTPAQIRAYLEYALDSLIERRTEMTQSLEQTLAAHPRIDDDATLALVAENRRMAEDLLRTAEARRKEHKDPFLQGGRAVDGWFSGFSVPMAPTLDAIIKVMNDYGQRKLVASRAKAAEDARRAQAEADAAAAAAREASRASVFSPEAAAAREAAEQAQREAEASQRAAQARPAEHTRVRGEYGAVTSMRRHWKWEVENIAKVPRRYLMINEQAIKDAAKERNPDGSPAVAIPGIKWVPIDTMSVR